MAEEKTDAIDILPPTVGEQLKSAREKKQYTIAEVAAQLRLTRETVAHLEAGNWDELHGRAYARGYLVSYANFLGLPQDELLTEFNAQYKRSKNLIPTPTASPTSPISDKRRYPILKLALLAAFLLIIWLIFQNWSSISGALEDTLALSLSGEQSLDNTFNSSVVEQISDVGG